MSHLYIHSPNGKVENARILLNNQPLDRLKRISFEMDETGKTVAVVEFYPKAIELNVDPVEVQEVQEVQEPKKERKSIKK